MDVQFLRTFAIHGNNEGLRTAQNGWGFMLGFQFFFVNLKALLCNQ